MHRATPARCTARTSGARDLWAGSTWDALRARSTNQSAYRGAGPSDTERRRKRLSKSKRSGDGGTEHGRYGLGTHVGGAGDVDDAGADVLLWRGGASEERAEQAEAQPAPAGRDQCEVGGVWL